MKIESIDDVIRVIENAKAAGLTSLELDGLKIRFAKNAMYAAVKKQQEPQMEYVPDMPADELVKPSSMLDDLTPEEILYYATPHFDELQAQKEEHKKKLTEETL